MVLYGLGDRMVVDGLGKFAGWIAMDFSEAARRMQSGNLRSYAGWLAFGAALVMAIMIFGLGHVAFAR
jgi:NADH-quinone oxidoreductase subunit L